MQPDYRYPLSALVSVTLSIGALGLVPRRGERTHKTGYVTRATRSVSQCLREHLGCVRQASIVLD